MLTDFLGGIVTFFFSFFARYPSALSAASMAEMDSLIFRILPNVVAA